MKTANGKILRVAVILVIAVLFAQLPLWPLLVEGRQFSQAGESLYQEWHLVSIGGFYDYYHYARTAWVKSTQVAYVTLAIFDHAALLLLAWLAANGLHKDIKSPETESG